MSAKQASRDFAQGRPRKLQRMKQPIALAIVQSLPPRNHVARAHALRAASSAAGEHVRSRGAQRRADRVALARLVRQMDW